MIIKIHKVKSTFFPVCCLFFVTEYLIQLIKLDESINQNIPVFLWFLGRTQSLNHIKEQREVQKVCGLPGARRLIANWPHLPFSNLAAPGRESRKCHGRVITTAGCKENISHIIHLPSAG